MKILKINNVEDVLDLAQLRRDIKEATNKGLYNITLLIETVYGSYSTVTASYYDDLGDELYTLEHTSYNFTLDEIKRYAILKVD